MTAKCSYFGKSIEFDIATVGDSDPQVLVYSVTRFANGGGELKIGDQILDVYIVGTRLSVTTEQGTSNYQKM